MNQLSFSKKNLYNQYLESIEYIKKLEVEHKLSYQEGKILIDYFSNIYFSLRLRSILDDFSQRVIKDFEKSLNRIYNNLFTN